jgi:hypothetical protein
VTAAIDAHDRVWAWNLSSCKTVNLTKEPMVMKNLRKRYVKNVVTGARSLFCIGEDVLAPADNEHKMTVSTSKHK